MMGILGPYSPFLVGGSGLSFRGGAAPPGPPYAHVWPRYMGGEGESLKRVLHSTALYRSSVILRAGWMEEG